MAKSTFKALTYRVRFIPKGTTPVQLIQNFFSAEDQNYLTVMSLFPSANSAEGKEEELTATLLFQPPVARPNDLVPRKDSRVQVDKDFIGFTPLYVPPPEKGPIVADIIAVTGLAAHAYGSWAQSDDRMWLRDDLKDYAPNARILTYGYSSRLQNGMFSTLHDFTLSFINLLSMLRRNGECINRPIIFIGHSLGCLIIKKALIDARTMDIALQLPVRDIIFFAAPHKGLHVDALRTLVKGQASEMMVLELRRGSPTLRDLNDRFSRMAQDIQILACYETMETKTVVKTADGNWVRSGPAVTMVSPDSARLFYPTETPCDVPADHSQIAKLAKGQAVFEMVNDAIQTALKRAADLVTQKNQSPNGGNTSQVAYQSVDGPQSAIALLPRQPDTVQSPVPKPETGRIPTASPDDRELTTFGSTATFQSTASSLPQLSGARSERISKSRICAEDSLASSSTIFEEETKHHGGQSSRPKPPQEQAASLPKRTHEFQPNYSGTVIPRRRLPYGHTPIEQLVKPWEEAFWDTSSAASCNICRKFIPPSDPHYGRCEWFKWDRKKNWWSCSACIEQTFNFPKDRRPVDRFARVNCVHWHHYVPFVDSRVLTVDTSVVKAIKQDDATALQDAIKNKELLTAKDGTGSTPLHLAAQLGREECTKILLTAGAPTKAEDKLHKTPLMNAIDYNHLAIVRAFLKHGVDIDQLSGGETALSCAVDHAQSDIVSLLLGNNAQIEVAGAPLLLTTAIVTGDEVTMVMLLSAGANVNSKDLKYGDSALHKAVMENRLPFIENLLSQHADINAVNKKNETPIWIACSHGNEKVTEYLLKKGADINIPSSDGDTPLHIAARWGRSGVVDILLRQGAEIEAKADADMTPLHLAAMYGRLKTCRSLLDARADVDSKWFEGFTALHLACYYNQVEVANLLLDRGADFALQNHSGETCLHSAAWRGNLESCQTLLARGANLNVKKRPTSRFHAGATPLHLAVAFGHDPIIKFLLVQGAEVDAVADAEDFRDYTSLHLAAAKGNLEACKILVNYQADLGMKAKPTWSDNTGVTPLLLATEKGHEKVVEFLLSHDTEVNAIDCQSYTSLHLAAEKGNLEICKILVRYHADLNMKAKPKWSKNTGVTPLLLATKNSHEQVVEFLLSHNAEVDATDSEKNTCLHMAAEDGNFQICKSLLNGKASSNGRNAKFKTPLLLAIQKGKSDVVKLLLDQGANPNLKGGGHSPLGLAAQSGNLEILNFLVDKGARLGLSARDAVSKAAYEGHVEVVKILLERGASGVPPYRLSGKWKNQQFARRVDVATQQEILRRLRAAKAKGK